MFNFSGILDDNKEWLKKKNTAMKNKKMRRTDDSSHEVNLVDLEDNQSSIDSENKLKAEDMKEEEEDGIEDGWNSDGASDLDMV